MRLSVVLSIILEILMFAYGGSGVSGVWSATVDDGGSEIWVRLSHKKNQRLGRSLPITSFDGLSASRVMGDSRDPVEFRFIAPAGIIQFKGTFSKRKGAGQFDFEPDSRFIRKMDTLGVSSLSDDELLFLTTQEFDPRRLEELRGMGHRPSRDEVLQIVALEVTPEYARSLEGVGMAQLSIEDLVQLRVARIEASDILEYRELGFDSLSVRELTNLGVMKATPAWIRSIRNAVAGDLDVSDLVNLRVGHIDGDLIAEYSSLGLGGLTARELGQLGIHKVTPDYIRSMRELGFRNLSVRDLVNLRIFGITPEYVLELRGIGFDNATTDQMMKLKMSGADKVLLGKSE